MPFLMRNYFLVLFFIFPFVGYTHIGVPNTNSIDLSSNVAQDGHPNKEDAKGRQGLWTIWGRMSPDKGYPENGKIEEGGYIDGRKNGEWVKFHIDGKTPRLKGDYVDNRPNGFYTKYYENGVTMEEGKFTSGKQVEVFRRYYDTGVLSQEKHFNMDGKEDGLVVYYHANGKKEFEYTKENGVTKGKATRYYPNGDVKEILMYNNDGTIGSRIAKERVNPPFNEAPIPTEPSKSAPDGSKGSIKEGSKFKPNSYNKIYNTDDELWMDGEFKKGKLWDGKLYKYDSDGILLKIEVWKNGSYHSDGQL